MKKTDPLEIPDIMKDLKGLIFEGSIGDWKIKKNADQTANDIQMMYTRHIDSVGTYRLYHGWGTHIIPGFHFIQSIIGEETYASRYSEDCRNLLVAWAFHDCVMQVDKTKKNQTNEWHSAECADNRLFEMSWKRSSINRVKQLILLTEHKVNPDPSDYYANVMIDTDLMGIAAEYPVFEATSEMVIYEYSGIYTRNEILSGRIKFFEDLLKLKGSKFFGLAEHEKYNKVAIENIRKNIVQMENEILS